MLTILVPITSGDVTETFQTLSELESSVVPSDKTLNNIYSVGGTLYYRPWYNKVNKRYEFKQVIDREFPELGNPLEIFDFTYDATRMGQAPTITAQNVKWYAKKDEEGKEVTLDGMWSQSCHVTFNNENYYLKLIPTASKSNEDARYNYNIDFVSERVVLEYLYLYDVVQPFFSERPVSESAQFSFYGDISELIKRVNASLLRSGLANLQYKDGVTATSFLTYEEFNSVGVGTYSDFTLLKSKPINWDSTYNQYFKIVNGNYVRNILDTTWSLNTFYKPRKEILDPYPSINVGMDYPGHFVHKNIYEHFGGDYRMYLLNLVYDLTDVQSRHIGPESGGYDEIYDGQPILNGYRCVIGKDKKGQDTTSDEKLITFENNTIHEALQQVYDTFELQYYVTKDTSGNTIITIGDCEHDFAEWDAENEDYVRDIDGIPTTSNPFDYGVEDALLSKEKNNATDKIITRITGVGSEENIPWYYPNPTADGWLRPIYRTNGEDTEKVVDYPLSEGTTVPESVRYEKYLKNRIGHVFQFGNLLNKFNKYSHTSYSYEKINDSEVYKITILYEFSIEEDSRQKISFVNTYECEEDVTCKLYKKNGDSEIEITGDDVQKFITGGSCELESGDYKLYYFFELIPDASLSGDVTLYYYPEKTCHCTVPDTWGWQMFLGILSITITSILSGTLWNGFDVTFPPFFSTNPNLQFHESKNAKKVGWKDGGRYISKSEMTFGSWDSDVKFSFLGGHGTCQVGTDDVYKSSFNSSSYKSYTAPIILGLDLDRYDNSVMYMNGLWNDTLGERVYIPSIIEKSSNVSVEKFIELYIDFSLNIYKVDGWYKNGKKYELADFGISNESEFTDADVFDTIEFHRIKYVTPQPTLMPEVYIKTDGERRFYNAYNYPFPSGTPDAALGEEQLQTGEIINPIYKENESDENHYDFENEYMSNVPREHIEVFEDVKPTIKGQQNTITIGGNTRTFRIDVVEEFAYDQYDNDEVWESNDSVGTQGEYKHPYFFAKLRPLGFNLFDLALQEDMVLSMTTGHCGACNFKIAVNEDTKKNPVQIWEYDVYEKTGEEEYTKRYDAGELRRIIIDTSKLYYYKDEEYVQIDSSSTYSREGFVVYESSVLGRIAYGQVHNYTGKDITNGEVGMLKFKEHTEGDVMTSGRYIESQQDTSENYVWVALTKDTDTYGTIMPSAKPDYGDDNYSVYIEPNGAKYYDRKQKTTSTLSDEDADKFVITNIRLPQAYLRRAERDLSRKIVAYMYDNNYQKFNFSIKFSRIFLAQNEDIDNFLNENSVLYLTFNNKTYRQYVKSYSYRMSHDAVLPEISVEMNEELNVSRTNIEQQATFQRNNNVRNNIRIRKIIDKVREDIGRNVVSRFDDTVIRGSMISSGSAKSFDELHSNQQEEHANLANTNYNVNGFVTHVNAFNADVSDRINQVKATIEYRLPEVAGGYIEENCPHFYKFNHRGTTAELLWLNANGTIKTISDDQCATSTNMDDIVWSDFDITQ